MVYHWDDYYRDVCAVEFGGVMAGKQKESLNAGMKKLREKFKAEKHLRPKLVESPIKPRYDDVYFEGLRWLNTL